MLPISINCPQSNIRDGDSEKGLIEVMYEEIKATMVKEEARPIPVTVTPWERKKLWLENQ